MICPNPEFFTLYHISKYYIATKSKAWAYRVLYLL